MSEAAREFLSMVERAWSKDYEAEQRKFFERKLARFTESELANILDKLLESCRFQPKVADIFDAARDLGCLQAEAPQSRHHDWEPTDCRLCGGEGLLQVYMLIERRTDSGSGVMRQEKRFSTLGPYSDQRWIGYQPRPGEYAYVFRCSCLAGHAPGLPAGLAKWDPNRVTARGAQNAGGPERRVGGFKPAVAAVGHLREGSGR